MHSPSISQAEGNLRVLKVCHFVYSGLTLLGLGFLFLHYFLMHSVMKMAPEMQEVEIPSNSPAPIVTEPNFDQIMDMMIWIYIALGFLMILIGALNLLSAIFMGQRKNRLFSIIISGLNCLNIPLGTVLGIFTIMFLMKPEAQQLYGEGTSPPPLH